MGVGILAKRVVLELSSSTNFVYSLRARQGCLALSFSLAVSLIQFEISDKKEV